MSVTISEPFLLSSYGLSKNLPKRVGELKRHSSYVYSTYDKGTKHSEGFATITAHGDGVHVLDVSLIIYKLFRAVFYIQPRSLHCIPFYHTLWDRLQHFHVQLFRALL
jgi:hypothetical protein